MKGSFSNTGGEKVQKPKLYYMETAIIRRHLKLTDLSGLAQDSMVGRCEYVNELSGFINHSKAKIKLNCF